MFDTSVKNNNLKPNRSFIRASLLMTAGLSALIISSAATAQTVDAIEDEVIATGTRQVIQSSINIKRQETTIVDGLSATEIGELPALSIGEALETITGASSHRENGGATEISIRGLGPFLSSTVFNGREATNGSGDRSVNFSQFPSELLNKLAIYKTQDASLIEGGVAGQIHLDTLKPLDYGKRRVQFDLKGNINPDQLNINDSMEGDFGYRVTGSYVDQFDLSGGGELGISLGGQISAISQPEQEIRSTSPTGSSRFACILNGTGENTNQGFSVNVNRDDDCEDDNTRSGDRGPNYRGTNDGYDTRIDPTTGLARDAGEEYTFAMSQRGYRQNDTSDKRDSLFGAIQWAPNNQLNVNLDAQWSERTQAEDRYDITFDNSRRNIRNLDGFLGFDSTIGSLITDGNGETLRIAYESEIASGGEIYERKETYEGVGLDVEYEFNDKLTASADVAYSKTNRQEIQQIVRVQSGQRIPVQYSIESGIPQYVIGDDFDVANINNYDDDIRLRVDSDVDRDNTVKAGRLDFNYAFDQPFADSIDFGVRLSEIGYKNLGGQRDTFTLRDGDASIYDCATPFAESNFLDSVRSGNLFTYGDNAGNVTGVANGWATFDNACLAQAILDGNGATLEYPELIEESSATTDLTETTLAGYVKANFTGEFNTIPVRGNFGVRVVNTKVDSIGYRPTYTIDTDPNTGELTLDEDTSNLEKVSGGSDYTEILPSFNIVADLRDDILVRGGIFRGLSRVDLSDMSFNRTFDEGDNDGQPITTVEDLLDVSASGNPDYLPLTSWNYDAAVEWYPNEDSLLAVGFYYKDFIGGFENAVVNEDFVVDGNSVTLPVTVNATNQDTAALYGVEITAAHRFSYLPSFWSGFGFKASYNYADSDFEFQDSNYGVRGTRELDGSFTQTHVALIAPANIPGLSKHVFSGQVYYQVGDFDVAAYYKYRDQYFQPYTSNGTRLRYVDANEVIEARASYKINDNYKLTVQGLNLFDEPRRDSFYQTNNFGQSSIYGPRIFFGVKGKF